MSLARELINDMIPPLKPKDTASRAISWMEELRTNQLPVVTDGKFIGLISEDIILESNKADLPVTEYEIIAQDCFVYEHQHLYEIIKSAYDHEVQVVAVLDEEQQFMGVITVEDILTAFAQTSAVQSPGAIVIISLKQIDYSLAEISRLVESENAKIISSSITNDVLDTSKLKLTLKINKTEVSRVIATLERFDYKIIGKYDEAPSVSNEQERLDILMKYLDM